MRLKDKQTKTNKQKTLTVAGMCGGKRTIYLFPASRIGTERAPIEINVDGPQRTENQSTNKLTYTTLSIYSKHL